MGEKLSLKQKLIEIRKSIQYLQKTERGNAGTYVDSAVLLKKIREKMDDLGVLLFPEVVESKNTKVHAPSKNNKEKNDYLSDNKMLFVWADAGSDEEITCNWHAVGSNMQDPAMAFGSALTYSERYFLLKFFQIPTANDDPDMFAQKSFNANDPATQEQLFQLNKVFETQNLTDNEKDQVVKFYCESTKLKELTVFGCEDLIQKFDIVFSTFLDRIKNK